MLPIRKDRSRPLLSSLLVLGLVLTTGACARNTETETGAARISDNPEAFIGQTVTVRGEVDDIRGVQTFTLNDNDLIADEDLLVIASEPLTDLVREPAGAALQEDDRIRVSGTVRRLVVTDIERELDFDLDPELEVEFRDRPVLVADEVWIDAAQEVEVDDDL